MQRKIYDMLSATDRLEYMVRLNNDKILLNPGFILGLYAWIGAAIIAKVDIIATLKLVVLGTVIPVIWLAVAMCLNAYISNQLEKEFTEKALCKQK